MKKSVDEWIRQLDLRANLERTEVPDSGLVEIYHRVESYLENTTGLPVCMSRRRCLFSLNTESFFADARGGGFRPVKHYKPCGIGITPEFRKYSQLRPNSLDRSWIDCDGKVVARLDEPSGFHTDAKRLLISPQFFREELESRRLGAIWCYDSMR